VSEGERASPGEGLAAEFGQAGLYEQVIGPGELHCNRIERLVVQTRTRFQQVEIVDLEPWGRTLLLDGVLQTSARDDAIYHAALVPPAMIAHPAPRSVLSLGGAEGATLRDVQRHPSVERAVMVDIDGELVELCRQHLPEWSQGAFEDPRAELRIGDGKAYLDETAERFDVIVGDLTDPVESGLSAELYSLPFYARVQRVLREGGLFVTQGYGVRYAPTDRLFKLTHDGLARAFPLISSHLEFLGSFDLLFGFFVASGHVLPIDLESGEVARRLEQRGLTTLSYYDAETHVRLCTLPKTVRTMLAKAS
jgi:spermidine synthase